MSRDSFLFLVFFFFSVKIEVRRFSNAEDGDVFTVKTRVIKLTNAERSWVRLTELQWIAVNQVFTDRWQIFLCAKIAGSFELREVRLTGVDGQELV